MEHALGKHRSNASLGLGLVDGRHDARGRALLADQLAAEKARFVAACVREAALVEAEERRREEQVSLKHDPRDAVVEKWLRDGAVLPSPVDQPEFAPHLVGRDELEAALFLNNPLARLTHRIKVKELRSGERKPTKGLRRGAAPGGEMTTRMRVASYEFRK